jgi:hypothetical protein
LQKLLTVQKLRLVLLLGLGSRLTVNILLLLRCELLLLYRLLWCHLLLLRWLVLLLLHWLLVLVLRLLVWLLHIHLLLLGINRLLLNWCLTLQVWRNANRVRLCLNLGLLLLLQ